MLFTAHHDLDLKKKSRYFHLKTNITEDAISSYSKKKMHNTKPTYLLMVSRFFKARVPALAVNIGKKKIINTLAPKMFSTHFLRRKAYQSKTIRIRRTISTISAFMHITRAFSAQHMHTGRLSSKQKTLTIYAFDFTKFIL